MKRSQSLKPIIYLLLLGSSWGLYFSIIKIAAESGLRYSGILAVTTAGVAVGLLIIVWIRKKFPVFDAQHIRFYLVCALLSYLLPFILEINVAAHIPASVLTLIVTTTPVFTFIIAMIVKSDRVTKRRSLGVIAGVAAVCVVLLPAAAGNTELPLKWLLLTLVVPVAYAGYHNYVSKTWSVDSDSFQVACGEAVLATILLLPVCILLGGVGDFIRSVPDWSTGHWAVVIMIFFGIVDIWLYFELLRISGPIFASCANYVVVITGVLWGMVIFSETLSPWLGLSMALLALSLYLIRDGVASGHKTVLQSPA